MLALPEEFELIGFFECEPSLATPDTPWEYNSITFDTVRGEHAIHCRIEPDVGELRFSWIQAGTPRLTFTLDHLAQIAVHLAKHDDYLIASGGSAFKQLVKIRLKPSVSVEWRSVHELE